MYCKLSKTAYLIFYSLLTLSTNSLVTPANAQDLQTIGQLARDGAPELALKLLDNIQPNAAKNIDGWLFFERQRIEIMRGWKQWNKIEKRLQILPDNAPADFIAWSTVEMVNAYLQQRQGINARDHLRKLIWESPDNNNNVQFTLYRRLIIRSYLVDNNLQDAQTAMMRYQQDYGNKGKDWQLLRYRILLRTEQAKEAVGLLQEDDDIEVVTLRLLAQLRSAARTAKSVLGDVRTIVKNKEIANKDKARLWLVGAEAAQNFGSTLTQIRALEQAAHLSDAIPDDDELFRFKADDLWAAYTKFAIEQGNQLHLLIGQDDGWLKTASQWQKKEKDKARSFYSMVIFNGTSLSMRDQAYNLFVESVLEKEDGISMLKLLFLKSSNFKKPADIPDQVRYLLVDDALQINDITTASYLMTGLEVAPVGSDDFEWGLRRSRVLVLGGNHKEGFQVLEKLITNYDTLEEEQFDRLLQVIFDLQAVGKDQQAIELFGRLYKRPLKPQTHRELLFWMADSYRSMGNLARAAASYLHSATLIDGYGYDPWGQTARFRAAEVLTEANMIEDARRVYENLMKITKAPERRAIIKYKLQELWLK